MKRLLFALIGLVALSQLLLYGCGDRFLTVNIDALSFMADTVVTQPYGGAGHPIPADVVEPFEIPPQQINLTEGLADLTDVQSVTLHLSSEFDNVTGSADVTVQVFISDVDTDDTVLYNTTPYVQDSLHVDPGTVDTLNVTVPGDRGLGELLTGEGAKVGIRTTFDSSGSTANVTGKETLIRFTATVVGKRHIP